MPIFDWPPSGGRIGLLAPKTIPSTYVDIDTEASDDDAFANAHIERIKRENHNILLARKIRRTLLSFTGRGTSLPNADPLPILSLAAVYPDSRSLNVPIMQRRIMISPQKKSATLYMRASLGSGSIGDAEIFGLIDGGGETAGMDDAVSATLSSATESSITLSNIKIPQSMWRGGFGVFSLYAHTPMASSDLKDAATIGAIADAGTDWVEANFGSDYTGKAMYFSDAAIGAREVVKGFLLGGSSYRLYADRPFNRIPIPGTDTVAIRAIQTIEIFSLALCEDHVSAWDTTKRGLYW